MTVVNKQKLTEILNNKNLTDKEIIEQIRYLFNEDLKDTESMKDKEKKVQEKLQETICGTGTLALNKNQIKIELDNSLENIDMFLFGAEYACEQLGIKWNRIVNNIGFAKKELPKIKRLINDLYRRIH